MRLWGNNEPTIYVQPTSTSANNIVSSAGVTCLSCTSLGTYRCMFACNCPWVCVCACVCGRRLLLLHGPKMLCRLSRWMNEPIGGDFSSALLKMWNTELEIPAFLECSAERWAKRRWRGREGSEGENRGKDLSSIRQNGHSLRRPTVCVCAPWQLNVHRQSDHTHKGSRLA